jgi:hypothetical protein
MRKAIPWLALLIVALIVIAVIAGAKNHNRASSSSSPAAAAPPAATTQSTTSASSTSTSSTQQPAAPSAVPKSGRCGDITVNQHTSCAFAQVVVTEYDAHPSATFLAHSPVTGLNYTMHCRQAQGVVACDDNSTSTLAFSGPPPASASQPPAASSTTPATPTQSAQSVEGPGSFSHATDAEFCSTHQCIENFPNGAGYIVQCTDGEWSHSGGRSGACSDHGGE